MAENKQDDGKPLTLAEIQEALAELEEQGLIRKTGEFRRTTSGRLAPVYVACDGDKPA
jgi:coproporphyrinogen III oxidase-like Fe-S oxidoreductase